MIILGLSAFGPLASAAVLVDGELVAASAEERFTRIAADPAFPDHAIRFCLERSRMLTGRPGADRVAVVDRAGLRGAIGPRPALADLRGAVTGWTDKQSLRRRVRQATGVDPERILFVDPLRAHAANAFLTSPFEDANILVVDGPPAGAMTATGFGNGASVDLEAFAHQPVPADALARIAADAIAHTGSTRVAVSGSLAGDSAAIAQLLRTPAMTDLFVPPAVHADGAALGAALYLLHAAVGEPRAFTMQHASWGDDIARDDAVGAAQESGLTCVECDEEELITRAVALLADGRVIGWAQEAAEWGRRPLGHRSILAGMAGAARLQQRLTRAAPSAGGPPSERSVALPFERAGSLLEIDSPLGSYVSRFGAAAFRLRPDVMALWPGRDPAGDPVPVQTVMRAMNPRFHALLEAFGARSGVPALVQAPLAAPGQPAASSAADALAVFAALGLDALVIDRVVMLKD